MKELAAVPVPTKLQARVAARSGPIHLMESPRTAPQGWGVRPRRGKASVYSRFVHATKVLLPMLAIVLIAMVLAWPHIRVKDVRFRIGFSALKAGAAEEANMVNPRYVGADKDQQPFTVTADLARNAVQSAAVVELEMPKADITLKDGTWMVLTAEQGIYGRATQVLDLSGAVNLFHDQGYEFKTQKARIELEKGMASGNEPVRAQGPFGDLEAEGFQIVDKGGTIYFLGRSKAVLLPGNGKAGQ